MTKSWKILISSSRARQKSGPIHRRKDLRRFSMSWQRNSRPHARPIRPTSWTRVLFRNWTSPATLTAYISNSDVAKTNQFRYNAASSRQRDHIHGGTHDTRQHPLEEKNKRSFNRCFHPWLPLDGGLGPDDRGKYGDRIRERTRGSSVGCRKRGFFSKERNRY